MRGYVIYGQTDGFAAIARPGLPSWPECTVIKCTVQGRSVPNGFAGGDFNGDGLSDLIVAGALARGPHRDSSYIVYGKPGGLGPSVNLPDLTARQGLILKSGGPRDLAFFVAGAAGDVNGDGFEDVLLKSNDVIEGVVEEGVFVVFGFDPKRAPAPQHSPAVSATVPGFRLDSPDDEPFGDITRFPLGKI